MDGAAVDSANVGPVVVASEVDREGLIRVAVVAVAAVSVLLLTEEL